VQTGQWILLNGHRGEVYAYSAEAARSVQLALPDPPLSGQTAQPCPSTNVQVLVNLTQPMGWEKAQQVPVDGVGLVRGEWLLLSDASLSHGRGEWHPNAIHVALKQRMRETLDTLVEAFAPRPVYYRAADLRTAEFDFLRHREAPSPVEHNSDLGLRGTLRFGQDAQLFEMELSVLKAVLQGGNRNLRLILPYVRSPQEVKLCLQKIKAAGLAPQDLPLWMMAEVPSVVYALDEYVSLGIQGIAIGLSDLTQLLLGIDRNHPAFADILAQNRFVVETAVKQLVQKASSLDIPCLLYGSLDVLNHEAWLDALIRSGLSGISVNLDAVIPTRWAIAQAERRLADGLTSVEPLT
ncbi:MAG: putative PEP-binding protein, partial [Thermosynechococcaceae cyanobacterium]